MQWLSIILGAGGVAFFTACFNAVQQWRKGTAARQRKLMDDMERMRRESREDSDWYLNLAAYWQDRCATSEFLAERGGVTLPEPKPLPVRPVRIQEV